MRDRATNASVNNHLHFAIQTYIEHHALFAKRDLLVVALSGGVDSVALLLSLHALGYRLHAYHLNHCLRGADAEGDAAFCRALCERYGIPITVETRNVAMFAASKGVSFETMGRRLRYEGLARVVRGLRLEQKRCSTAGMSATANTNPRLEPKLGREAKEISEANLESYGDVVVVTGHHAGDAAETFVMNVLRGAGLDGLTSIQRVTTRAIELRNEETGGYESQVSLRIARPLLSQTKQALRRYVEGAGESWCEDVTNTEPHYLRNRVRQTLNEEHVAMIGRTISLISEDRAYIESRIDALENLYLQDFRSEIDPCVLLRLDRDVSLHPVEFGRLIRRAVRRVSGHIVDLSKKDVEAIARLERTGAATEVAGRVQVYRSYEGLEFRTARNLLPKCEQRYEAECEQRYETESEQPNEPQHATTATATREREWRNARLIGETEDYRVWAEELRIEDMAKTFKKSAETSYGWVYLFDAEKVRGRLSVRTRLPGDRMVPLGMQGHRKVKEILIDSKVVARMRDRLALVQDEEKICLIGGVRMSEEVKLSENTRQIWKVMVERK